MFKQQLKINFAVFIGLIDNCNNTEIIVIQFANEAV